LFEHREHNRSSYINKGLIESIVNKLTFLVHHLQKSFKQFDLLSLLDFLLDLLLFDNYPNCYLVLVFWRESTRAYKRSDWRRCRRCGWTCPCLNPVNSLLHNEKVQEKRQEG